jgi:hypothetical protein
MADHAKSDDDVYLVWSNEYGWARPHGWGWSFGLEDAAHFSRADALELCRKGLGRSPPLGRIAKLPIRLADVQEFLAGQDVPAEVMKGGIPQTDVWLFRY